MLCKNCKKEISDNTTFCPFCGSEQNETNTPTTNPTVSNRHRETVNIMGIHIPIVFISAFAVILGFGGYITPLLLVSAVLLLTKVENKSLTSNFLVVFTLYASQFIVETLVTFIASIPTKFIEWLSGLVSSTMTLETLMNISAGFSNVFNAISGIIGLAFFVLYIMCIVSLVKSDKIRIPFITDLVKKFINNKEVDA